MPDLPERQATPDELAALYLRARDVPCPGCGYNRRDGTAAACPECTYPLNPDSWSRPIATGTAQAFFRWTLAASVATCIVCMDYFYWAHVQYWFTPISEAALIGTLITLIAGTLATRHAWITRDSKGLRAEKAIRAAQRQLALATLTTAFVLLLL